MRRKAKRPRMPRRAWLPVGPSLGSPLLTLCVIARDEEERLEACLASAARVVDDIVVVDTGSTDRTREIARNLGARVLEVPWRENFSAPRNAGLDAARGRWVLFLDADERLDPVQGQELKRRLLRAEVPAFTVEIVSPLGSGEEEVAHVTRLVRSLHGIRFEGRIHESVLPSVCRLLGVDTWTPPRSGLRIHHEGYLPEVRAARAKHERNRRLLLAEIESRPGEPGPRFLYARENTPRAGADLLDLPGARRSRDILEPAVRVLAGLPARGITDPALFLASRLHLVTGDPDRAAGLAREHLRLVGRTARWCWAAGERELLRGDPRRAAALFREARTAPEGSENLPAEGWIRHGGSLVREALALYLAGRPGEAASLLARVRPGVEPLLVRAFVRASREGPAAAVPVLGEAVSAAPADPRCWWALSAALALAGDRERAADAAATARRAAPGWAAVPEQGPVDPARAPAGLLAALARLAAPAPALAG